ncbi:MAG: 2Fe-2S iron-sulfur cluster-binding protein [bacterium]|nr:2Fe-2S iron-sulfur cluster-binding protein [bacterium]
MKKFKINSVEYSIDTEKTIFEFLKDIGIYVPTLCYHPYLRPIGSCRVCVIKDRGKFKNSCATIIDDGMDIETHTPELIEMRKWILQFLFSERNHYCMYCCVTNDCEFQNLGYYTGLDHFHFPTFKNIFDIDNSHPYILFDNNRCVLCSRCVRVCSEVAGHFVLSENNKGEHSIIVADNGVQFGKSSCTSCGLCVQVCPTGTFVDKYSMYLGRSWETQKIGSYCFSCPVGCGIEIYKRGNNIVKIYSDWDSFTKGLICHKGRYEAVINYRKYKNGSNIDIYENLNKIVKDIDESSVAVVDGTLFNEEIEKIRGLFPKTFALYKVNPKILDNPISFDELDNYQTYIIAGWDLNKEYGTIGSVIKRNKYYRNCKVIYLDEGKFEISGKTIFIYKNYYSSNFLNGLDCDHLVLPLNTNDVGLLKLIGNKTLQEIDNLEYSSLFIFSRDLNLNISNITGRFKRRFLFTIDVDRYSELFDEVFPIVSEFEVKGSFYNLFNQLLCVDRVFDREVV